MRALTLSLLIVVACHESAPEQQGESTATEAEGLRATSGRAGSSTSPDAALAISASTTSAPAVGSTGHSSGSQPVESRDPRKPTLSRVRMGAVSVNGRLPPEVVQRIVRRDYGKLRKCYDAALDRQPKLEGRATTSFVIDPNGKTQSANTSGELADKQALGCIQALFAGLEFPKPESGSVKVVYPIVFAPPAYKFTIADKPSARVEEADVVKALTTAGYKVSGASDASLPAQVFSRFKAEKAGITFSLTLDPAARMPLEDYEQLRTTAVMLEDGAWVLFVESKDPAASRALVDAIHKKLRED